ncbi:MAG TPA: PH domain-containing protein [Micromonosporaceae bacterium]|nr:PH domain-containing protein [Micromonosporaceae bacterium]
MSAYVRFRHNVAVPVTGLVAVIAVIPLAGARWYLLPLLLIPVLVTVWGWRSGVDVDRDGLTVRALVGTRRLAWSRVTGFTTRGRRVYVLLDDQAMALPAVTTADLGTLITAGDRELKRERGSQ